MDVLNLNSLQEFLPDWSAAQCNNFVEALCVGLTNQNKVSGAKMEIEGSVNESIILQFEEPDSNAFKSWKEPIKIAEDGATAMAFFLTKKYSKYEPSEEAAIGTSVDYWLILKKEEEGYDPINFMNARLEVSGIIAEKGTNTIENRVKAKVKRTEAYDSKSKNTKRLPVVISVTELATPKSKLIIDE